MGSPSDDRGSEGSSVGESRQLFMDWARSWRTAERRERWLKPLLWTAPVPTFLLLAAAVLVVGPGCGERYRHAEIRRLTQYIIDCKPFQGSAGWTTGGRDAAKLVLPWMNPGPKEQALRDWQRTYLGWDDDLATRQRSRALAWTCPSAGATLDGTERMALERGHLAVLLEEHRGDAIVEEGSLKILRALTKTRPRACAAPEVAQTFAVLLRSPLQKSVRETLAVLDESPARCGLRQTLWDERLASQSRLAATQGQGIVSPTSRPEP